MRVQIFEHFLNAPRPHFYVAFCRRASGAKIAQKIGKKICKPSSQRLAIFLPAFPFNNYSFWHSYVYFRLIPPFPTPISTPSAVQPPFLILPVNSHTRESDGDVFHFNQYVNFVDDAAEQEYLDEVAKRAFYTTGDYARADERLLTLCTCTYEMSDARLLIMARPLRDGETLTADEVIINPDPLLPARWPAGA